MSAPTTSNVNVSGLIRLDHIVLTWSTSDKDGTSSYVHNFEENYVQIEGPLMSLDQIQSICREFLNSRRFNITIQLSARMNYTAQACALEYKTSEDQCIEQIAVIILDLGELEENARINLGDVFIQMVIANSLMKCFLAPVT